MPPVLDRRVAFDERSKQFPMRALLPTRVERVAKIWDTPRPPLPTDQGREGACCGHGWSAELACDPVRYPVSDAFAYAFYLDCRKVDQAEGRYWDEGASVLAGAKVAKQRGLISSYRWAFGIEDCIDVLCSSGPVVLGIPWWSSMYGTQPGGMLEVSGEVVGGHCILAIGYLPEYRPIPNGPNVGPVVVLSNSWGPTWGINGIGYMKVADLDRLLRDNGEACIAVDVPLGTPKPPAPKPAPARPWWRRWTRW